jgi:hypothetical protein
MSADEYRAHADALIQLTQGCRDIDLVVELEATAVEWLKLAALAEAQEALIAAIAARLN